MQYFLPNRKTLSGYYQAASIELPTGGTPRHMSFKWAALGQLQSDEQTKILDSDTVLWGIVGSFSGQSVYVSPQGLAAGVFLNIYHVHQEKQRPFYQKPRPLQSVAGSNQKPFLLKPTYIFKAGDSVMVEVKSTDATNPLAVEITLFANTIAAVVPA